MFRLEISVDFFNANLTRLIWALVQLFWAKPWPALQNPLGFRGVDDDAIHALLCAVGYNLRWLLRAIVRGGIKSLFLRLRIGCCWAVISAAPALWRPKRDFVQKTIAAPSPWLRWAVVPSFAG